MRRVQKSKQPIVFNLESNLLEEANKLGLDIETLLDKAIRNSIRENWLKENAEAIEAYNKRIDEVGAWSDGFRKW